MIDGFLSDNVKITVLSTVAAGAAGATDITSDALDMQGFDAVLFYVPLGPIVANGVQSVKVQQADDSDGDPDDFSDLVGTGITVADDADNGARYVDVSRPQKRYLKVVFSRATQNSTIGGIHAFQYKKGSYSSASHATGVSGEQHNAPAEGTA